MPLLLVNLLSFTGTKGGGETYVRELYRALGAMETEFEFVGYASKEFMSRDHSWFPGEVVASHISGENRITWALGEIFAVSLAARRLKAELIHGPMLFGPLSSRVPVVVTIHDLLYFSNPELMSNRLYTEPVKWMEKRGAANATRIITISNVTADAIGQYLRFPDDRVDLIPLAGTAPRSGPIVTAGAREPDLFLSVGTRRPHKNHAMIIAALATIDPDRRPRLVITGSHGADPLIPVVAEHGLDDWVDLRSWVPDEEMDSLYARATALVDASFVTGFSLPTLEAMMAGLPVVLADTPIFREVGGRAARYFDPRDAQALGVLLEELAGDQAQLNRMTQAGLAWSAEFSWSRVAERTLASFRRALDGDRTEISRG